MRETRRSGSALPALADRRRNAVRAAVTGTDGGDVLVAGVEPLPASICEPPIAGAAGRRMP